MRKGESSLLYFTVAAHVPQESSERINSLEKGYQE
jgi:hypothetical protein